jgi:putative ABC transport system permease protein
MIIKNLQVAFRHLGRQKLNTTLHIVGLTLGISVCLLIALFLRYETSFDAYHEKADRTYRINSIWVEKERRDYHHSTPLPLADALRKEATGFEHVALAHPQEKTVIEINPQKRFAQDHILIVEPDFLDIFKVESISGNPYQVLRQPFQALLTESIAKKFFGNEDPLGKTFRFRNDFEITVGGIIRDLPSNTQLPASMLLSFVLDEKFLRNGLDSWSYVSGTETFVVLPPNGDLKKLGAHLNTLADKYINSDPRLPKFFKSYFDLQPLADIHFNSTYAGGGQWVQAISPTWLWFFALIGFAVLVLACINFMNLSTAQALTRAKEVGVRKSVGAGRFHLISQFLTEAWLLALISGILAITITQSLLPYVNALLEKGIAFDLFHSPEIMTTLFIGILVTGLLAGIYPAWIISRFNPAKTLKATSSIAGDYGSSWLRKSLVVTQFTISAGLLIALILISQQVSLLRNQDLGFDKKNIVNVAIKDSKKAQALYNELIKIPQIKDVAFATATPSNEDHWGTRMSRKSRLDPDRKEMTLIFADEHYGNMYNFRLKAGQFFKASDTSSVSRLLSEDQRIMKVIVNEKLISTLGYESAEAAIGERFWIGFNSGRVEVVGVVNDFNTSSLHKAILPTLITQDPNNYSQAGIKLQSGAYFPETLATIEAIWKQVFPNDVFEFKFLDDQIDGFYKAEERIHTLFKIFAGMAMLISCLGLWGLATYSAQQRTKEVGIRKILGASVNAIIILLSKDFLLLVGIALIIASPIAYYLIQDWLLQFAYHISIGWQVFAIAGIASLTITVFTVCIQALKAAFANPVNSLRNE